MASGAEPKRDIPFRVTFLAAVMSGRANKTDEYAPKGWTAISRDSLKEKLHCGDKRLSRVIDYLEDNGFLVVYRRKKEGRTWTNLYRLSTSQKEFYDLRGGKKPKSDLRSDESDSHRIKSDSNQKKSDSYQTKSDSSQKKSDSRRIRVMPDLTVEELEKMPWEERRWVRLTKTQQRAISMEAQRGHPGHREGYPDLYNEDGSLNEEKLSDEIGIPEGPLFSYDEPEKSDLTNKEE
jgi:DNA-binding PadR family transcriptional regulator